MVQKLSPAGAKIVNETILKHWQWRRVRAFLITSLSVFLLLVLAWAINVKGYRSDNSLAFRLSNSDQQLETLNAKIFDAMRDATSDDSLVDLVKTLKGNGGVSSSVLLNSDLDTLRERVKVYTREIKQDQIAEARFSFVGNGSPDETRFLANLTERIYSRINSNINSEAIRDFAAVDNALDQVGSHLRSHLERQNDFNSSFYTSVSPLDQQLGRIREHIAELDKFTQPGAFDFEPPMLDEQVRKAEPKKVEIDKETLDKLTKHHQQNQYQHQHSSKELSSVEKQIAVLRTKTALVSLQNQEREFESNQFFDGTPRFENASFPKKVKQPTAEMVNRLSLLNQEFQSLNTAGLHSVFDSIQDQRSSDLTVPIEYIENFKQSLSERVQTASAVSLVEPGTAKVVPVGGVPTDSQMFLITVISLGFGVAIAWRLNPADTDRGFRDASGLSDALGVPVVGSFPLQSANAVGVPMATRIVSLCKIGLPILLLIIAGCCLLSQNVWSQMVENPIRGLVRVVWLFKGR